MNGFLFDYEWIFYMALSRISKDFEPAFTKKKLPMLVSKKNYFFFNINF